MESVVGSSVLLIYVYTIHDCSRWESALVNVLGNAGQSVGLRLETHFVFLFRIIPMLERTRYMVNAGEPRFRPSASNRNT